MDKKVVVVDGALATCTTSTKIENQLPRQIVSDHPKFVQFLKAYYEWMEKEGNPIYELQSLRNNLDIDSSSDQFLEYFKREYLQNIPVDLFGVNRNEQETFITDEDFGGALTYACLCEGESVRYYINSAATVALDNFPTDYIKTSNWMVSIMNEVTGERQSVHIMSTQDGVTSYDVIYAQIGPAITYDLETRIDAGRLYLDLTNNEAGRLIVDVIRAPTFEESEAIGPRRTYLLTREVNDQTDVKVFWNGALLAESQYTISDPIGFCGNSFRELTIDETVLLAIGDEIRIEYTEVREVNERLLIKTLDDLYSRKGTAESVRLLFRLLFNEEVELEYPGENILRASDGKWQDDRKSIRVTSNGTPSNMLYRRVNVVKYDPVAGEDVNVGAFSVQEVQTSLLEGFNIADLFVGNITGDVLFSDLMYKTDDGYKPEYRIKVEYTDIDGTFVSEEETILPILDEINIDTSGTNYSRGVRVPITDGNTLVRQFVSDGVTDTIDTGISTTLSDADVVVTVDPDGAATVLTFGVDYTLTGSSVVFTDIAALASETIKIAIKSGGAYVTISEIDGAGGILGLEIFDPGVGYTSASTIDVSGIGGGDATLSPGGDSVVFDYGGFYVNQDGHLSSTPVLQDGFKNQAFSYIIKSERTLDQYADVLRRLVHPAGFLMFGEIALENCISIADMAFKYNFEPRPTEAFSSNSDVGAPKMGPRYRSFDENKLRYLIWDEREPNTNVSSIYSELVEYFVVTPDDKLKYLLDGYIQPTLTIDAGTFTGAGRTLTLPVSIDATDTIIVTGSVTGDITPTSISYGSNQITFDADVGGETITVTIIRGVGYPDEVVTV